MPQWLDALEVKLLDGESAGGSGKVFEGGASAVKAKPRARGMRSVLRKALRVRDLDSWHPFDSYVTAPSSKASSSAALDAVLAEVAENKSGSSSSHRLAAAAATGARAAGGREDKRDQVTAALLARWQEVIHGSRRPQSSGRDQPG